MRLAFLGTPEAAVPSLRALVSAGHDVALVVTRPDRRRGRGAALSHSPVHEAARDLGLDVAHTLGDLAAAAVERGVVVAYGALVPAEVLARIPMLNVHFSLLPRWRGAAPVERAILAGDVETGVSVMTLEATLDTGPVHLTRRVAVDDKRVSELTGELADLGAAALVEVLATPHLLAEARAQDGEATYAAKLLGEDYHLTPAMSPSAFLRTVRLERAFTVVASRRLRVVRAHEVEGPGGEAGEVVAVGDGVGLVLAAGVVALDEVVPEGGRSVAGDAWWRGARLDARAVRWA